MYLEEETEIVLMMWFQEAERYMETNLLEIVDFHGVMEITMEI